MQSTLIDVVLLAVDSKAQLLSLQYIMKLYENRLVYVTILNPDFHAAGIGIPVVIILQKMKGNINAEILHEN